MSKFWQKKYISKYSGAEIDAAVAKAGTVPAVTSADSEKILGVDAEGKIVAKDNLVPTPVGDNIDMGLIVGGDGKLKYTNIGNIKAGDSTMRVESISEGDPLVMEPDFNDTAVFLSNGNYYGGSHILFDKPAGDITVNAATAMTLLSTGTATFRLTQYRLLNTVSDLNLNVDDYIEIGDKLRLNMDTDMCIVHCVNNQSNSVLLAGSFLTAANPLLANKLVYLSVLIQSDGTGWDVTLNIIKYGLST